MVYSTVVYKFHINIQSASKEDPSFGGEGIQVRFLGDPVTVIRE